MSTTKDGDHLGKRPDEQEIRDLLAKNPKEEMWAEGLQTLDW